MIPFKSRNGDMLIEVLVALAMISVVSGVFLTTQGRSVNAGTQTFHELFATISAEDWFVDRDRQRLAADQKPEQELLYPAQVGTMTFSAKKPSKKSSVQALPGIRQESILVTWRERGNDVSKRFVRFVFEPEKRRE